MSAAESNLNNVGYIYNVSAGFQFDLNSVLRSVGGLYTEGHLCDHNCSSKYGNYDCPAAFAKNKGVDAKTLVRLEEVDKSLGTVKKGLALANQAFVEKHLENFCERFQLNHRVCTAVTDMLQSKKFELNLFGGNPELHPSFTSIIKIAKGAGWKVTTTTTGKKFLHDDGFTEVFTKHPPDLLAISADDFESMKEVNRLLEMSLEELKTQWQKVNPLCGQRKKSYESVYVARLAQKLSNFPRILFNMVVHPGNIGFVYELIDRLHKEFPNFMINPYPAQGSFCGEGIEWDKNKRTVDKLEKFVDTMITKTIEQTRSKLKTYVPRLPYWLALKSVFTFKQSAQKKIRMLTGYNVWRCYRAPGAGRYIQASGAPTSSKRPFRVGAHPGCFWNTNTITSANKHLWKMDSGEVSNYLIKDKVQLAKKAANPCAGCIMPRLMFDGVSVELGLNPVLVPTYLKLRKEYCGF